MADAVGASKCNGSLKRSYVTLAQNADSSASQWQKESVVIGSCVSEKSIRRSGLLSGLKDTEGLASLPGRLCPEDVRLWEAAYVMNIDTPSEDLVTVLKVADVLEDGNIAAWVDILAKRIISTKWGDAQQAADMLCATLQLPSHLLRRLLTACLGMKDLDDLLVLLPGTLCPALVSSCASTGSITLPGSAGYLQVTLSQLAMTTCPPPGLLSIALPGSFSRRASSATTAALLAHAISSHPSLTALNLSSIILPVKFFHQLSMGLINSTLPNLVSFEAAIQVHPDGCMVLAHCLKHLSPLTYLRANLFFNTVTPNPTSGNLRTYAAVAVSPAPLAELKQLVVQERHNLAQRDLHPCSHSVAHRLFPLLAAPNLTSLEFSSDVRRGSMPAFIASLRHMAALRVLHIDADMHDLGLSDTAPARACDSSGEDTLPQLHALTITSACIVSPVAMAAAVTAATCSAVTQICMHHVHSTERTFAGSAEGDADRQRALDTTTSDGVQKAWADFLRRLGACSHLKNLQLSCLCSAYDDVSDAGFSEGLASALLQLPLLTRLRLEAVCTQCAADASCEIQAQSLCQALRGLTGLRELGVCGAEGALEVSGWEHMLAVLPELRQLTSLGLCFLGLQQTDVADLMPKLRSIETFGVLPAVLGETDEQVLAFTARFPKVEFCVYGDAS